MSNRDAEEQISQHIVKCNRKMRATWRSSLAMATGFWSVWSPRVSFGCIYFFLSLFCPLFLLKIEGNNFCCCVRSTVHVFLITLPWLHHRTAFFGLFMFDSFFCVSTVFLCTRISSFLPLLPSLLPPSLCLSLTPAVCVCICYFGSSTRQFIHYNLF